MAKNKNKSKGVTAGDLFGKLGREKSDPARTAGKASNDELEFVDAIDATSDADSDSDLDIHALLKKYMPEYQDGEGSADDGQSDAGQADSGKPNAGKQNEEKSSGRRGGLLSALKNASAQSDEDKKDEELIGALDSAFSLDESGTPAGKKNDASEGLSVESLARRMLGIADDAPFDGGNSDDLAIFDGAEDLPDGDAVTDGKAEEAKPAPAEKAEEPAAEPEEEPFLPSLASLMSSLEDKLSDGIGDQPESEAEKAEEPETVPEPVGDDLLTDAELELQPDGGSFQPEEEKPRGLFGRFGKKKKSRAEAASQTLPDESAVQEAVPAPADIEAPADLEAPAETAETPAEPEARAAEPAPAAEKPKRGLFSGSRLEALVNAAEEAHAVDSAAEEVPAEEETSAVNENPAEAAPEAEVPEEAPEAENADDSANAPDAAAAETVSEDKLAEMVREMEDKGETVLPDDSDSVFDPSDLDLMVAFGLDQKEGRTYDKAKEFGDKLQARQEDASRNKVVLDRAEFVDKTQTPAIRQEYKRRETSLWIRLLLCAVFAVTLLIFENIETFTNWFTGAPKQFAGILDFRYYPTVYIMVSLQLMLLACVCAYDEILYGLRWLFRGNPRPQTVTALLAFVGLVYSIAAARLTVAGDKPRVFNFVIAMAALLTLISALFNVKRERMNFRVVANKRAKHIVRRLREEESEGETQAFSEASAVCDVMKIEKTDFVEGFFARLQKPDPSTGTFVTCVMSITVAAAVLFGLLVKFRGGAGADIAAAICEAALLICPLSVFIAFAYPYFRANVAARNYDSAIIGESSLEEYSNASIISFDDKNVFPSYSVKVQNIRIYNNARIDRVLYYAASVFAYAGGPLQDVFEVATKDMGISDNVKIFDTEAGFLATQVDGVNIIFGQYDALTSRGLYIDERAAEEDVDVSDELEIMYMFRESKLVAKMYVKYVMDADMEPILKQFSGSGLYVCVRTFDPNIDERMIAKKLNMKKMPLKIVRYVSADEVIRYEAKVDSGLVTCGTPKSLLQVISFCGKVLQSKKTNVALCVLSVLIGASILVLLLLANSLDKMSSLGIALYQILWLIIMSVSSRAFIR